MSETENPSPASGPLLPERPDETQTTGPSPANWGPGLAIGGAAAGFLAGLLLPSTRVEDEKLGEVSDQVMEQVKETGQDALDRGKQVASEAVDMAKEVAVEGGKEQGKKVAENVKETAREAAPVGGSSRSS